MIDKKTKYVSTGLHVHTHTLTHTQFLKKAERTDEFFRLHFLSLIPMNLSRVDPLNKNQPSFKRTLTGLKVAFTKGCHCTQTHGESATGAGVVSLLVPDGLRSTERVQQVQSC